MLYDHYPIHASADYTTFNFTSSGPKGNIIKVIEYTKSKMKGFYNLALGDKDPLTGIINYDAVSNNRDSKKILITIAVSMLRFIDHHPGATIVIIASTEVRIRLYRRIITNYIDAVENELIVLGLSEDGWESFYGNMVCDVFFIKKKM